MHELSIAETMLEQLCSAQEREGFSRVSKVYLAIGELSHVDQHAMSFCFDTVVAGTCADGAKLEIEMIPGKGKCSTCGAVSGISHLYEPCPKCESFGLRIVDGNQIKLEHIEVE